MFKFKDLSNSEKQSEFQFNPDEHRLTSREFLEKRLRSSRSYLFDLRSSEKYVQSHIPGAHSLPIDHFENSIYQMPFSGDILLYGSGNGEALTAAEILYDNGFDSFYFIENYGDFFKNIDASQVTITDAAKKEIEERLRSADQQYKGIRLTAKPKTALKAVYTFAFVSDDEETEDIELMVDGIKTYIPAETVPYLDGTLVDIVDGELDVINKAMGISKLSGPLEEQVKTLLEEQINPMLAAHGGMIHLMEIKDNAVYLKFGGGCHGCGMANVTFKQGVEVMFKENIPEITAVYDVSDHASGSNPYHQSAQ